MRKTKIVTKKKTLSLMFLALISSPTWALKCDGKVTGILSGSDFCSAGQRVGFIWEGGSMWLCSDNKNMDALLMTAYASGKNISVVDHSWTTCNDAATGYVPNRIWFKEP